MNQLALNTLMCQHFFIFMQFSGKCDKMAGWHPLWEILNLTTTYLTM